jgi:hypothetical protein
MSDLTPLADAGIPAGDNPPAAAPPEAPAAPAAEVPAAEVPVTPAPEYLDLEAYGNHLVKVKIAGEDRELPLSEVRNGLMMQADYTRRTQELAEERRRLASAEGLTNALDGNPEATIRQLAEIYDLDLERGLAPVVRTPEEQQLRQQQQALSAQEESLQRQRLDAEIATIRAADPSVDVPAVAAYAMEQGLPTFTLAYRLYRADQAEAAQKTAAANAAAAEAARRAALVTHDGTATQAGVVTPGSGKAPTSIREAWALAQQQQQQRR